MEFPEGLETVISRARRASIGVTVAEVGDTNSDAVEAAATPHVTLHIPNGRKTREIYVGRASAEQLATIPFEQYSFVGDYEAIVHRETGEITARVAPLDLQGPPGSFFLRRITRLPGVVEEMVADEAPELVAEGFRRSAQIWSLDVSDGEHSLRLGSVPLDLSVMLQTRRGFGVALSIAGERFTSQDAAIELLEQVGGSFFFELDLRHNITLTLVTRRLGGRRIPTKSSSEKPAFPKMTYPAEPLSLYNYGRSANRLPLLEFLAYYQTLEYFFPIFSRLETANRLRRQLKDPRFDVMSDLDINKVINLSLGEPSGARGERQQMRATVRACAESSELAAFIEANADYREMLAGKRRLVRGVEQLHLSSSTDLRDQVADRLYGIRCRVVHTKHEGDDSGVELLLPSSEEVRSLGADIALAQYLARQALITSASPWRPSNVSERKGP